MSPSLLCVVILLSLSTAALGQGVPPECTTAIIGFSQNSACFGSPDATSAFLTSYSSVTTLGNPLLALYNSSFQQGFITFFNNFCTSQACVQSYADAAQVCLGAFAPQVNTANIQHYIMMSCIYKCGMICMHNNDLYNESVYIYA